MRNIATGCARHDGLEHRLGVGRRARDDAQDFPGRGLLGQGLVAFGGALVEFAPERATARCRSVAASSSIAIWSPCLTRRCPLGPPNDRRLGSGQLGSRDRAAHVLRARIPVCCSSCQRCCGLLWAGSAASQQILQDAASDMVPKEPLDHCVHLVGNFELIEVSAAAGPAVNDVRQPFRDRMGGL